MLAPFPFLSAGTQEAARRVIGAGGVGGKASCASPAVALAEDPTLRPSLATVAARCR